MRINYINYIDLILGAIFSLVTLVFIAYILFPIEVYHIHALEGWRLRLWISLSLEISNRILTPMWGLILVFRWIQLVFMLLR